MLNHVISGNQNGPAVLMGSSLGTSLDMWANQLPYLEETFRVVRFDTPGHGKSLDGVQEVAPGELSDATVDSFAAQVLELANHLDIDSFHYVGLSLGGAIGQQLALDAPERLQRLVLTCTAAKFGDPSIWTDRGRKVREEGLSWLREPSAQKWYADPENLEADATALLDDLEKASPQGYAAATDAVSRFDVTDRLSAITTPTLVIAGAQDVSTPPAVVETIANGIDGARFEVVDGAGHLGNIDQPEAFGRLIGDFLRG